MKFPSSILFGINIEYKYFLYLPMFWKNEHDFTISWLCFQLTVAWDDPRLTNYTEDWDPDNDEWDNYGEIDVDKK